MEDDYTFVTLPEDETEKPSLEASLSDIIEISTSLLAELQRDNQPPIVIE